LQERVGDNGRRSNVKPYETFPLSPCGSCGRGAGGMGRVGGGAEASLPQGKLDTFVQILPASDD